MKFVFQGNDDHFDDNGVGDDFDQAVEDGIGNHLIDAPDTVFVAFFRFNLCLSFITLYIYILIYIG